MAYRIDILETSDFFSKQYRQEKVIKSCLLIKKITNLRGLKIFLKK